MDKFKKVAEIYETDDYDIFQYYKENRDVQFSNAMLEEAKKGYLVPITVNEKFYVIDGQNRIHHSKIAGVPVRFQIKDGATNEDIKRVNVNQNPWTIKNYIDSYSSKGNYHFIQLKELLEKKYTSKTTVVAAVLSNQKFAGGVTHSIKAESFKVFDYELAEEFLKFYRDLNQNINITLHNNLSNALWDLYKHEGVDLERLKENMILFQEKIDRSGRKYYQTMEVIVDAYNYHVPRNAKNYLRMTTDNDKKVTIERPLKELFQDEKTEGK